VPSAIANPLVTARIAALTMVLGSVRLLNRMLVSSVLMMAGWPTKNAKATSLVVWLPT